VAAAPRSKKKVRTSYVQNTAKQSLYAVLQQLDAERQAEVAQIVQPLTTLQQPEAKRIAATVEARSTELDSVKQLYSEIEKLEQDLKQRRDSEQERIALRKMSLELRQLIIEEDELVEAYSAAMAADALALLAVVGVRV
jgi:tyrosyl-tRNA synthetase